MTQQTIYQENIDGAFLEYTNNCEGNDQLLGYKFRPNDAELVHFLGRKISNQPVPRNIFHDVELYTESPATLTAEYKSHGDNQWYFFSPRIRKYPRGERPNRAAGNGYWKGSGGSEKSIMFNKTKVGSKRALVFYEGKAPEGTKTEWLMQEYTLHNAPKRKRTGSKEEDMKLDDWVLCKVYKKGGKVLKCRDDTEGKHKIDEHLLVQPQTINEQKMQTPVSVAQEISPWNPVFPNHQNQEQTLMLPNLWNQEQHQFLPIQNGFLDQQITTMHGMAMMPQSSVNSDNRQHGHLRYNDQHTNVTCDYQQQGLLRYDDQQTNVTGEVMHGSHQRHNQPVMEEYDIQQYIHPDFHW